MPDTLIIGGGCHGASLAYHLCVRGLHDVALVERRGLAGGNTGKSGAIVRQHYSTPATAALAHRALHVFQHFATIVGGPIDPGFRQTGLLVLAGPDEAEALRANVAMQQGLGIGTELVDGETVRAIEPRLAPGAATAYCWEPEAGYADPVATTAAYAQAAVDRGATLHLDTTVTAIRVAGDRVQGVETSRGFLPAARVVVAANVWGPALLAPLGVAVPIVPSRHPIVQLRQPADFGAPHPVVIDLRRKVYLRPDGATRTWVGSVDDADAATPAVPDRYHEGVTQDEIVQLSGAAAGMLPALGPAIRKGGWAGLYDVTPDWQPVLGAALGPAGLYLALGFSGHGFKLCPVVGDLLAQLITTGEAPDLHPYRPTRFAEGQLTQGLYAGVVG
ncbi:MAG TPA: FAD-dependent oxidoreductase [Chloroflexia bacterium]|nr:FAD-dependent oxidoreductase [Chloroflexia bacterium]